MVININYRVCLSGFFDIMRCYNNSFITVFSDLDQMIPYAKIKNTY